jgi:signal transduction histidine kinase
MKRRLVFTLMAVTMFAMAGFFLAAASAIKSRDLHVEFLELRSEASNTASRLSFAGDRWKSVQIVADDNDHSIAVYRPSGELVKGSGRERPGKIALRALHKQAANGSEPGRLVAAEAVRTTSGVVAVVEVSERASVGTAKSTKSIWMLGWFALGLILLSAGVGWLLMRPIAARLNDIQDAATRIGAGDFTARLPQTGLVEFDRVVDTLTSTAEHVGVLVERERAFSAEASHQLRTPVASFRIALEAELLSPRTDHTQILREGIETLDRLNGTVTTLLALARNVPTDRGPLDVHLLLAQLKRRWQQPFRQKRRSIEIAEIPSTPANLFASHAAISHVLDVLVDNALKHGSGNVVVRSDAQNGGYLIRVTDAGTLASSDQLFRARKRLDPSVGIGLALARTLAAAEGAVLRLASTDPTAFELVLAEPRMTTEQNDESPAETNTGGTLANATAAGS